MQYPKNIWQHSVGIVSRGRQLVSKFTAYIFNLLHVASKRSISTCMHIVADDNIFRCDIICRYRLWERGHRMAIRLYSIGLDLIDKRAFIYANTGKFSIYCVYLNRVLKTKLHNLSRIWKSFIKSETTSSQFASSHYVHVLTFLFALNELFVDQSLSPLLSNIHWLTFWRVNISIMRQAYKSSFSS